MKKHDNNNFMYKNIFLEIYNFVFDTLLQVMEFKMAWTCEVTFKQSSLKV